MGKTKRKGNGSGTVYACRNKAGKIISYRGSYFTPDGKRHYVSAKRKSEAEKLLREAMTDANRGFAFDCGTLTLGDYLDRWIPNIKDTVRQRTWERYEQLVRVHIKPTLGNKKLKDLTRAHVKGLYREKLDAGSSPGTVRHIHVALHKALKDAVEDGLVPRNVANGLKPSKPKKKEINPLNSEQAKSFLEAVRGERYEALYVLAIHYGLRQGELLGLKWADLNLDKGILQVRRTMSETREGRLEEETKSGKGRRIDLSESVIEALRSHRKRQNEERLAASRWEDHGLVFPSSVIHPQIQRTSTTEVSSRYSNVRGCRI